MSSVDRREGKTANFGLDAKLRPIRVAFRKAKAAIDALPTTRMRALALTDLESAFARAIFAASDIPDPIASGDPTPRVSVAALKPVFKRKSFYVLRWYRPNGTPHFRVLGQPAYWQGDRLHTPRFDSAREARASAGPINLRRFNTAGDGEIHLRVVRVSQRVRA